MFQHESTALGELFMWTIIVRAVEIRLSLAQFLVRGHFSRPFKLVTRILKSCARNLWVSLILYLLLFSRNGIYFALLGSLCALKASIFILYHKINEISNIKKNEIRGWERIGICSLKDYMRFGWLKIRSSSLNDATTLGAFINVCQLLWSQC